MAGAPASVPWVPPRLGPELSRRIEAMWRGEQGLEANAGLLELAIAHQVAAPIADRAAARGEVLPKAWARRLAAVRAQNLATTAALSCLRQPLEASGLPWLVARGAARLADPLIGERLCGDVDLYLAADDWPAMEAALLAAPGVERLVSDGEVNRSTRHMRYRFGALSTDLDLHLAVSPFHPEDDPLLAGVLDRRQRNADGLWVPSPGDDLGLALVEALIEAPANRLRRLWELDVLRHRLPAGERRRMGHRFGLMPWAAAIPRAVFLRFQGRSVMAQPEQLAVRYGGLAALLMASRHPIGQARSSAGLMLRRLGL